MSRLTDWLAYGRGAAQSDRERIPEQLPWPALATLFVAAFVSIRLTSLTAPTAFVDTLADEYTVRSCLHDSRCAFLGMASSVPGLSISSGWLHIRAALEWLGLSVTGVYVLIQLLTALTVVIAGWIASCLGGRTAGWLAAVIAAQWHLPAGPRPDVVYNSAMIPFFGAVFLAACVAVVRRPEKRTMVVAGLAAALLTSAHTICAITVVSLVWVALLTPRPWPLLRAGFVAYGIAVFLISPPTWIENFGWFFNHGSNPGVHGGQDPREFMRIMTWGLGPLVIWLGLVIAGVRPLRRAMEIPVAVAMPLMLVLVADKLMGSAHSQGKYLAHLGAAVAVGLALPVAAVLDWFVGLVPDLPVRPVRVVSYVLPFFAAAFIASRPSAAEGADETALDWEDLRAVVHVLRDERGWGWAKTYRDLKSRNEGVTLASLKLVAETWPDRPNENDHSSAILMKLDVNELPSPLPSNWMVVRSSRSMRTTLIFTQTWLDWSAFRVCQPGDSQTAQCNDSGLKPWCGNVPGMPDEGHRDRNFRLHIPVHAPPGGGAQHLYMPNVNDTWAGRVVSASHVDATGQNAELTPGTSELVVAWKCDVPYSNMCPYHGFPPFFVEGDADTVTRLQSILEDSRNARGATPGPDASPDGPPVTAGMGSGPQPVRAP